MNFETIFNEAMAKADKAFHEQKNYGMGSCGYAQIVLTDKRQPFNKWYHNQNKNSVNYKGQTLIRPQLINEPKNGYDYQSIDKQEKWCYAFFAHLKEHNIKGMVQSNLL